MACRNPVVGSKQAMARRLLRPTVADSMETVFKKPIGAPLSKSRIQDDMPAPDAATPLSAFRHG
jgi:hypothetical protein